MAQAEEKAQAEARTEAEARAEAKGTLCIDRELCHATGMCEAMAPELFTLENGNDPVVLRPELYDDETIETAQEVADCCPNGAIVLTVVMDEPGAGAGVA